VNGSPLNTKIIPLIYNSLIMGLMRTEMWQKLHGGEMRKGDRIFRDQEIVPQKMPAKSYISDKKGLILNPGAMFPFIIVVK